MQYVVPLLIAAIWLAAACIAVFTWTKYRRRIREAANLRPVLAKRFVWSFACVVAAAAWICSWITKIR